MTWLGRKFKRSNQKTLKLVSNYSEVAGCKVNIWKSITCLNIFDEQVEFEIKNIIIFILIPPYEILRFKSNKICTRYTWEKLPNSNEII